MSSNQGLTKGADPHHADPRVDTHRPERTHGTGRKGPKPNPDLLDQSGPRSDDEISVPSEGTEN